MDLPLEYILFYLWRLEFIKADPNFKNPILRELLALSCFLLNRSNLVCLLSQG